MLEYLSCSCVVRQEVHCLDDQRWSVHATRLNCPHREDGLHLSEVGNWMVEQLLVPGECLAMADFKSLVHTVFEAANQQKEY